MKRKVRFYFLNILLFIVILMLALVLFVWFFCGVRKRTYEGCQVYTEDQLTGLLFKEKYDKNTITCSVMSILRPKKGIPFIESVSVRPASLTEVHVTVKEKERYGVCDTGDGKYVYFDSAFKVVEISDVLLPGSFLVSLPPFEKAPAVGEALPAGSVQKKILQTVKKETADRGIAFDRVTISDDGSITMTAGTVEIRLGSRQNLKEKIMRLPYILPRLKDMTGTLHLEDWTEENTDIVFEKAS